MRSRGAKSKPHQAHTLLTQVSTHLCLHCLLTVNHEHLPSSEGLSKAKHGSGRSMAGPSLTSHSPSPSPSEHPVLGYPGEGTRDTQAPAGIRMFMFRCDISLYYLAPTHLCPKKNHNFLQKLFPPRFSLPHFTG